MYYMLHLHEEVMPVQAELSPCFVCSTAVPMQVGMKSAALD